MTMEYKYWDTTIIGKPYYFFYFHIPTQLALKEQFNEESIDIQSNTWKFLLGRGQRMIAKMVIDKIKQSFDDTKNLIFACVPTSTRNVLFLRLRI